MTPEKSQRKPIQPEDSERPGRSKDVRYLDVWARSAPIRLAGYEDDLAEPHILQGID